MIRSILFWLSILTLSLTSITIALNIPFIPIILAQEEGEDLVEMEMNNGTTISIANGSGMILGDGTNVVENRYDERDGKRYHTERGCILVLIRTRESITLQ